MFWIVLCYAQMISGVIMSENFGTKVHCQDLLWIHLRVNGRGPEKSLLLKFPK